MEIHEKMSIVFQNHYMSLSRVKMQVFLQRLSIAKIDDMIHVFGELRKHLHGREFQPNDEVQEEVQNWFLQQSRTFYE